MNKDRQRHSWQSVWYAFNIILLADLNIIIRWRFELSVVIYECLR